MRAERRYGFLMSLRIETEQELDGRWLADVPELPGAMTYGATRDSAIAAVRALALRIAADRLENGEAVPEAVLALFLPNVA